MAGRFDFYLGRIVGFIRTVARRARNLARVGWVWVRSAGASPSSSPREYLPDKAPLREDGADVFLGPEDLRPGDVLFSSSDAVLGYQSENRTDIRAFDVASPAWWVRAFDEGWYSHVSYYDGEQLVEATLGGVKRATVAERVESQRYIDVYRYRADDGKELGSAEWPAAPLHAVTHGYQNAAYATHDLVFGGMLALMKGTDLPGVTDDAVRVLIRGAVEVLRDVLIEENREHLTCSELVYRIFNEAEPAPRYRLRLADGSGIGSWSSILPAGFEPMGGEVDEEGALGMEEEEGGGGLDATEEEGGALGVAAVQPDDHLAEEFWRLYWQNKDRSGGHAALDVNTFIADEDLTGPNPDFVTPRDLAESPSLIEIGRLRKPAVPQP